MRRASGGRAAAALAVLTLVAAAPAGAQVASWTSDRQEFRVGDIISVLLDEYTLASANRNEIAEQERSRTMSAGAAYDGIGVGQAAIETENSGRSRDRGQATRHDRLTGEMTVRVTEVGEAGLLKVEGTKRVTIDEHEQELKLTGWVRPEDVGAQNVMESWRIADAAIEYRSTGDLGRARQGLLSRIIGWIWP